MLQLFKSFQSLVENKTFLCLCVLGTGILQYSLPEALDAGYHSWPKGENSAHCQESGQHQKRPLQAQLPGILSSLVLLSCAFFLFSFKYVLGLTLVFLKFSFRTNVFLSRLVITPKAKTNTAS